MHLQLISKIENKEAIENIDSIIEVSDGVMIDRTDLSLDSSIEKIPYYQKMVLEKARIYEKIGIIATDMMLNIMESPENVFNQVVMSNLYFEKTSLLSPLRTGCREENRREYKVRTLEAPADVTERKCEAGLGQ